MEAVKKINSKKVIFPSHGLQMEMLKSKCLQLMNTASESYAPADSWNIIINEVDFLFDYLIFSQHALITFLSMYAWPYYICMRK